LAQKPELLFPSAGQIPTDLTLTADGARIAVSQVQRQSSIWSLPLNRSGLAAGEPKPLIRDSSYRNSAPAFSADGSKLAYESMRQGGDWMIFVANADGSSAYPLTPGGQSSTAESWVGNDSLAYLSDRNGKKDYWISPLHGRAETIGS
jgi:Tol biopolymer transport system component